VGREFRPRAERDRRCETRNRARPRAARTPAEPEPDPTKTESYRRERVSAVNKKIQDLEAKLQSPATSDTARRVTEAGGGARPAQAEAKNRRSPTKREERRPRWLR
jgi:hypothetical protein